ncbi:hypothetical protein PsorP6_018240 [Peronosclerospora sorghi]|uniref:Uncharacterized protein n=1 Tax=Peronosclerospora sorghi TaxID=230839 RepID=A0ACC0WDP3_9STRA|nr:hypothetical protein PsorP6_018240 [Peronosclerospora sorghi]
MTRSSREYPPESVGQAHSMHQNETQTNESARDKTVDQTLQVIVSQLETITWTLSRIYERICRNENRICDMAQELTHQLQAQKQVTPTD